MTPVKLGRATVVFASFLRRQGPNPSIRAGLPTIPWHYGADHQHVLSGLQVPRVWTRGQQRNHLARSWLRVSSPNMGRIPWNSNSTVFWAPNGLMRGPLMVQRHAGCTGFRFCAGRECAMAA